MARSLADLRQYLAGEWLFDNDFKDTSGNGNDAVPVDIEWASTLRGLKPSFAENTSLVNCGNDSSLTTHSPRTISFVVKIGPGGSVGFFTFDNGFTGLSLIGNNPLFRLADGNSRYFSSFLQYRDNKYHHVVIILPAITQLGILESRMFVDGIELSAGSTSSSAVPDNWGTHVIGKTSYGNIKGVISDFRIYDTEFTTAEALALYNATSGEYGVRIAEFSHQHDPAAVIPITADTVMQIGGKLAGDAVDTISDRSGEGNDATIHGAMPTDGFLAGGRRFVAANGNYLDCGNDSSLDVGVGDLR